jgi:quercetin 2,3-dioxygenase
MNTRTLQRVISSIPTSDGAGVKLRRSLGQSHALRLDPFLMLDEFSSMNADDYIAGFPEHPHRGFETVTYMLDGNMLHQDHLGNRGELKSGGAQWMTAGRGIIHSEMPQQQSGRLRGFQLWLNLPAKEKMKPAGYRDIQADEIPKLTLANGGLVKIIAGSTDIEGNTISGPIQGASTEPLFLDVRLPKVGRINVSVVPTHNAFIYAYENQVTLGALNELRLLETHAAGVLSLGNTIEIQVNEAAAFLVLAAKPLKEPVVQYGSFVMNTREEIELAISDYKNGQLV